MINGNSANFDRRLAKLENSKLGVPANLAGFRIPKIIVHEGDDVDQIIKDMEARGEIPSPGSLPAGQIRVICIGSFLRRMANKIGNVTLRQVPISKLPRRKHEIDLRAAN